MKRSHTLLSLSGLAAALAFAGCSDDPATPGPTGIAGASAGNNPGTGGAVGGSSTTAGTPAVGGATAGSVGTGGATAGSGGSGGATAGSGGAPVAGTGGTPSAGTGGSGGMAPVVVPAVILIDNIRLQPAVEGGGGDGSGGDGAGGVGGAGGEVGTQAAALLAGGAGGDGGAGPVGVPPDFIYTFDAMLDGFGRQANGFSPGPGMSGGVEIYSRTLLEFEAATGNPGGAAKVTVPFNVATQQADFGVPFAAPVDLTGYELTADVKLVTPGDEGACIAAWPYVYGANGYANDLSGEPSSGVTTHLVKDVWKKVRLNLDGPYGYHSTSTFKNFKPTGVIVWGIHINTWGCP